MKIVDPTCSKQLCFSWQLRDALLMLCLVFVFSNAQSQTPPPIEWTHCYGGSMYDQPCAMEQTNDGGYVVVGNSSSTDGDVTGNHGQRDIWVVKLDGKGVIQWQSALGGDSLDQGTDVKQARDGGYVVVGSTSSNNGQVVGNHGDEDGWIAKLNSAGIFQWGRCLGGSRRDGLNSVQQTDDGGYVACGSSYSDDGDISFHHGSTDSADIWLVKVDSAGKIQWEKSLGGNNEDDGGWVQQTIDGGFIIAGNSQSTSGDVTGNHGSRDIWIVKVDFRGKIQWEKSLGGQGKEDFSFISQTRDGGFVVSGWAQNGSGGDIADDPANGAMWIVKLRSTGTIQWQSRVGAQSSSYPRAVQTADGGYIVSGTTYYVKGMQGMQGFHGTNGNDCTLIKLDSVGKVQWEQYFGGTNDDVGYWTLQSDDGGFVTTSMSNSNDGDVSGYHQRNNGNYDFWIFKLAGPTRSFCLSAPPTISPGATLTATVQLLGILRAPVDSITFDLQYDPTAIYFDSMKSVLCLAKTQQVNRGLLHVRLESCTLPLQDAALCELIFTPLVSQSDTVKTRIDLLGVQVHPLDTVSGNPCSAPVTVIPLCGMQSVSYVHSTTLTPNFPNPFGEVTTFHVTLSESDAADARLHVYNMYGAVVQT